MKLWEFFRFQCDFPLEFVVVKGSAGRMFLGAFVSVNKIEQDEI